MNIKDIIKLAENGDIQSIYSLGQHYLNNNTDEAIKWFSKGAKKGSVPCIQVLPDLIYSKATALRKFNTSDVCNYDEIISLLNKALYWETKLKEYGHKSNEIFDIICAELGIVYYLQSFHFSGDNNHSSDSLEKTISLLKPLYPKTHNAEILLYLGFALYDYSMLGKATTEDISLSHFLLKKCVDNYFEQLPSSAIAAFYLGLMYTEGQGCKKNYGAAVYYLQKSHNTGHDCSQILSRFKKKLFGGYTFQQ